MVLAEEVLFQEHRSQLLCATLLRKYKFLKQFAETLIVNEVGAKTQLGKLAGRICQDSISDGP